MCHCLHGTLVKFPCLSSNALLLFMSCSCDFVALEAATLKDIPPRRALHKHLVDMDRNWEEMLHNYHRNKQKEAPKKEAQKKEAQKKEAGDKTEPIEDTDDGGYKPFDIFKNRNNHLNPPRERPMRNDMEDYPPFHDFPPYRGPYPPARFRPIPPHGDFPPYGGFPPYGSFPPFPPRRGMMPPYRHEMGPRFPSRVTHLEDLENLPNARSSLPEDIYKRLSPSRDVEPYREHSEVRSVDDSELGSERGGDREYGADRARESSLSGRERAMGSRERTLDGGRDIEGRSRRSIERHDRHERRRRSRERELRERSRERHLRHRSRERDRIDRRYDRRRVDSPDMRQRSRDRRNSRERYQ